MSQHYIGGIYSLQDIKHDILKIIEPFDGYMYNQKETESIKSLFIKFLGDLKRSSRLHEYSIENTDKDKAVTFDLTIRLHRDRSPKKLKIHVGKLIHYRDQ